MAEGLFLPAALRRDPALRPRHLADLVSFRGESRTLSGMNLHGQCRDLVQLAADDEDLSRNVPQSEQEAVAAALTQSLLRLADIGVSDADVVAMGPASLTDRLLRSDAPSMMALSGAGLTLHDALLVGVCAQIVAVLTHGAPVDVPEPAEDLVTHWAQDGDFEEAYRDAVEARYSTLELAGVPLRDGPALWPLRGAYIEGAAEGYDGGAFLREPAHEMVRLHQRVLLRGEVGSGKTTLVQWLAVSHAHGARERRVPFVLRARHFDPEGPLPTPEEFVGATVRALGSRQPEGWVSRVLVRGDALIMVDGVDEAPEIVEEIGRWIRALGETYPGNTWLVTSRPAALPEQWLRFDGFVERTLEPLSEQDLPRFVGNCYQAAADMSGREVPRVIREQPREIREQWAQELLAQLQSEPDLKLFAANRLLCAVLCALHWDRFGALPERHFELPGLFLDLLLGDRDRARGVDSPVREQVPRHQLPQILGALALQHLRDGHQPLDRATALDLITEELTEGGGQWPDFIVPDLLDYLEVRTGLLRRLRGEGLELDELAFPVLTSYAAAWRLLMEPDPGLAEIDEHALDPHWYTVILHAAAQADLYGAEELLTRLLALGEAARTREERTRLFALAALCLRRITEPLDDALRQRVKECLTSVLPPQTEEEAEVLQSLGVEVLALLPDPADAVSEEQASVVVEMAQRIGGAAGADAVQRFGVLLPVPPPGVGEAPSDPPDLAELPDGARKLAVSLSVATRIEPELLRAVRTRVHPRLDAGDEADLWFSPWVAVRTRRGIALRPDVLPVLRAELARQLALAGPDDPLRSVGEVIAEVHAELSPALVLEERVNWLHVSREAGRTQAIEQALRPALRALVVERRAGVADWLAGAWERLPAEARSSVTGWQLHTVASHLAPELPLPAAPERVGLTADAVAAVVDELPDVPLGVRRTEGRLELGVDPEAARFAIPVPDTRPRVLEVLTDDDWPRTVALDGDGSLTVAAAGERVRVRTSRGAVFEVPSEDAAVRGGRAEWREREALAELLETAGLRDAEVMIGYVLPGRPVSELDAIIAGRHPRTGEPSYVIVDFKFWRRPQAGLLPDTIARVERTRRELVARHAVLAGRPERVSAMLYLVNATETDTWSEDDTRVGPGVGVFTRNGRLAAAEFLRSVVAPGRPGDTRFIGELLDSADTRTIPLESRIRSVLRSDGELLPRAEQRDVLRAVPEGGSGRKEVVIVNGGPRSGKSMTGLFLLGAAVERDVLVRHVSGSRSMDRALRQAARAAGQPQELFAFPQSFAAAARNDLDLLICDDAQRLRRGPSQVLELVDAARVTVFLVDESQAVHPDDVGNALAIEQALAGRDVTVREMGLQGAGPAAEYAAWVDALLYPESTTPHWIPSGIRSVEVVDDPAEMEYIVRHEHLEGRAARITAGYCWPRTPRRDAEADEPLARDVTIGDWARPWHQQGDRAGPGAPAGQDWPLHPTGIDQIGTVYAAAGFEFDWCGVIIGPDLLWRDGRWVVDRHASKDPALRKQSVSDELADRCIRNAYRVLMTRGTRGTVLYSTDPETRDRLRQLVPVGGRGRGAGSGSRPSGGAPPPM
ncbi:DNA/RNA helicase domain-containing protein [Streptomyces monticola]|uniref:DNA/RNA helicase domain-containing protein n=1 Tax=Streptomyces monticola TaxID=2666263 RepID=A0ABW2JC88_9ACTN